MPFAVTLRLDPSAGARVSKLWDGLADAGLSDLRTLAYAPHITLAVLSEGAPDLAGQVATVAAGWNRLAVRFAGFGVFPGPPAVLWLAPVPDASLLACQRALCDRLPGKQLHPHYRPGAWVPHVTLAEDLTAAGLAEAMMCLAGGWASFEARLEQVDVVQFRPVSVLWHGRLADVATGPALR